MKIALLINRDNMERYSNPADIDPNWELIHMGNGTPDADALAASGANVLVVDAMMKIGEDIISRMPNLKLIHSQGVAYNGIDLDAASKARVYVCNNAGVNARPVAEQALLLMMALLRGFRTGEDAMYDGRQEEAKNAFFANSPKELGICKVGIVGFGAIGSSLAHMLAAMGSTVFWYDVLWRDNIDASYMPMEEIFRTCDIVSLHLPVVPSTINIINDKTLADFKDGAILINTSRGELVDNEAVVRALQSGKLRGFGTDTLAPEPVTADNSFLKALPAELRGKVALSPHIAGLTAGSFQRTYVNIWSNIAAVERGDKPVSVVNKIKAFS